MFTDFYFTWVPLPDYAYCYEYHAEMLSAHEYVLDSDQRII